LDAILPKNSKTLVGGAEFQPEYAGKLNYYLSAVDSQLRKDGDNSTIGIILCKMKNKLDNHK
jgi:hypothetical protein